MVTPSRRSNRCPDHRLSRPPSTPRRSTSSASTSCRLEGHADNTPLNRDGYTNWNLSTDRAVAVVNVLVEQHQVPPQRLTAAGFGEFRPRDPGTTAEAKARNRRVELIVVAQELDGPATQVTEPAETGLADEVRADIESEITGPG